MSVAEVVRSWDGKDTAPIIDCYNKHSDSPAFAGEIVSMLGGEGSVGASWLLKHHLEKGFEPDAKLNERIFSSMDTAQPWETRLHLLQSIPFLTIPETRKDELEEFLRNQLADKNKFVRAWAYGAFYRLADVFPEYRGEARVIIGDALENEAASVKARIRNSVKSGFMAD